MKSNQLEMTLLYDYYGGLLTEKQRICFDLYYNQDFSLQEIAQNEGISRQGVQDSIRRAEASLREMEEKTGCIALVRRAGRAFRKIETLAQQLGASGGEAAQKTAAEILSVIREAENEENA